MNWRRCQKCASLNLLVEHVEYANGTRVLHKLICALCDNCIAINT